MMVDFIRISWVFRSTPSAAVGRFASPQSFIGTWIIPFVCSTWWRAVFSMRSFTLTIFPFVRTIFSPSGWQVISIVSVSVVRVGMIRSIASGSTIVAVMTIISSWSCLTFVLITPISLTWMSWILGIRWLVSLFVVRPTIHGLIFARHFTSLTFLSLILHSIVFLVRVKRCTTYEVHSSSWTSFI